jgi:heme exporter protein A
MPREVFMSPAIEIIGLTKVIGERAVLRELHLVVEVGETLAVHGHNGAGKTTLLRCLANILQPSAGQVLWFGTPTSAARSRQGLVGLLSHESYLYAELTVEENLLLAARLQGVSLPQQRVNYWLEQAELRPASQTRVDRLSRGMRQRVSLVRAILHDPQLILLDEPCTGLDEDGQRWLIDLCTAWRRERRTLCFTSHDNRFSERIADRCLWLKAGCWDSRTLVKAIA